MNKLYKLKPGQEAFRIVDGIMAGRGFAVGTIYHEVQIPAEYLDRFEPVEFDKPPRQAKVKKAEVTDERA